MRVETCDWSSLLASARREAAGFPFGADKSRLFRPHVQTFRIHCWALAAEALGLEGSMVAAALGLEGSMVRSRAILVDHTLATSNRAAILVGRAAGLGRALVALGLEE